jgi:hypothetical protein
MLMDLSTARSTMWLSVAGIVALAAATASAQSPLDRTVSHLSMFSPTDSCGVGPLLVQLGNRARIPLAFELAPGPCWNRRPLLPGPDAEPLEGLTVQQVLTRLVAVDARYSWRLMGGVVVVRPAQAWSDASHFLSHAVSRFHATVEDMDAALATMTSAFRSRHFWLSNDYPSIVASQFSIDPSPDAGRTAHPYMGWIPDPRRGSFDVSFGGGTLLEALNALVDRPGHFGGWILHYCRPEAGAENAVLTIPLWDDAVGRGYQISLSDAQGRGDPCGTFKWSPSTQSITSAPISR